MSEDSSAALEASALPVFLRLSSAEAQALIETGTALDARIVYLVLDSRNLEWDALEALLPKLQALCPVLLDDEFNTENTPEILDLLMPAGLNLHGGKEVKVGIKAFDDDYDAIRLV